MRAEGVFVLRLSDHLPPLLTGPKFFPALEDEGDEEEADKSSNRGREGASGFKPGKPVLAEGKVRRAKGSKASSVRCARPRLKDGGSSKQLGRSSQAAFSSGASPHQAVESNTMAAVLPEGLASKLAIPASWARVPSQGRPTEDAWSQDASNLLSRPGDVPHSGFSPGTRKRGLWPSRRRRSMDSPELSQRSSDGLQNTWQVLLDLVQEALASESPKESEILSSVEQLEPTLDDGSLEHWTCHHILDGLSATSFSREWWYIAVQAVQEVLKTVDPGAKRTLTCITANVTQWRKEVATWLFELGPDVAAVQETHLDQEGIRQAQIEASKAGYQFQALPAGQGKGVGTLGGVAILTKNHLGARLIDSFITKEGCGWVAVALRVHGRDLTLFSLYLQSGVGPTGGCNPDILAHLAGTLSQLQGVWVVMGDFNHPRQEMTTLGWVSQVKGRLLGPNCPTAGGDNELDYTLVHSALEGVIQVSFSADVPFRPHGAVTVCIPVQGLSGLVNQLKLFPAEPELGLSQSPAQSPLDHIKVVNQVSTDPHSLELGEIYRRCEQEAGFRTVGRGWYAPAGISPLVAPLPPGRVWRGKEVALWQRWKEALLKATPVPSLAIPADAPEGLLPASGTLAQPGVLEQVELKLHQAKQKQKLQETEDYQAWLSGATNGSLGPLYKVLKSSEQVTARPYRNLCHQARAFERALAWCKIWDGTFENQSSFIHPRMDELRQKAQAEVKHWPQLTGAGLAKLVQKAGKKKGGCDGWSYAALRLVPESCYDALARALMAAEQRGSLPVQMMVHEVALLPKDEHKERPISLTPVLWRLYCSFRKPKVREWVATYVGDHAYDSAVPGGRSLDVALRRLLRAEHAKVNNYHMLTLFIDLQGFYDGIRWQRVLEQGLDQGFPAPLLALSLCIYQGPRCLNGESVLSPPIYPRRGLLQGCPLAPTLAKLALETPLQNTIRAQGVTNADLWLDDISIDAVHRSPAVAAGAALSIFRQIKQDLDAEGLEVSSRKTHFVGTSSKAVAELKKAKQPTDPDIQSLAKDLGIDSAGARRRRLFTANKRFRCGVRRVKKLNTLRVPCRKARVRVLRTSPFAAALYGHEAQGIAPKRLKVFRASLSKQLGRAAVGSVDVILDLFSHEAPDPQYTVVVQQAEAVIRCALAHGEEGRQLMLQAWQPLWQRQLHTRYGWQKVSGPLSALIQYLQDLGVDGQDPLCWKWAGHTLDIAIEDPCLLGKVRAFLAQVVAAWRTKRFSQAQSASGAENGVDWTAARRLLRADRLPARRSSYKMVFQGLHLHEGNSGLPFCQWCGKKNTPQHLLYDCKELPGAKPAPKWLLDYRSKVPDVCLWQRGMLPKKYIQSTAEHAVFRDGIFAEEKPPWGRFVYATDASGGRYTKDPRLRHVGWAVIAAVHGPQGLTKVGTLSGVLMNSTVSAGESEAIINLLKLVDEEVDVTTDSRVAMKQLQSASFTKTMYLSWGQVWSNRHLARATWIRSHTSNEGFAKEFGSHQSWRRTLNDWADSEAGKRANAAQPLSRAVKIQYLDRVVAHVIHHLAQRVQAALDHTDKDLVKKTIAKRRQQTREQAASPATGPNKKQRMQAKVDSPPAVEGHQWEVKEFKTNFTMKCKICQLYIESCKTGEVFERLLRQPCIGFETEVLTWPDLHSSHNMINKGCMWQCSGCGRQARPSSLTLGSNPHSKKLVAPCPARNRLTFQRASSSREPQHSEDHVIRPPGPQGQGEMSRPGELQPLDAQTSRLPGPQGQGELSRALQAPSPKAGPPKETSPVQAHPLAGSLVQSRSEDQGPALTAQPKVQAHPASPGNSRPQGLGVAALLVPKAKVAAKRGALETPRKASALGKAGAKSSPGPSIKTFFAPKKGSGQ